MPKPPPQEEAFDRAAAAAFDKAAASGSLDDIDKAASVRKTLTEALKNSADAQNIRRQQRSQAVSVVASALVPIVSIAALFWTIHTQTQQLKDTQKQSAAQLEDTQWRDFLKSLGVSGAIESDVSITPRLRSFFNSAQYGAEAKDIAIQVMGRLTNTPGFEDLYKATFVNIAPNDFDNVLNIARTLNNTRLKVDSECWNTSALYQQELLPNNAPFGACTMGISIEEIIKKTESKIPQEVLELRQTHTSVENEIAFISLEIGEYLRSQYIVGNGHIDRRPLDLHELALTKVDLSRVDFHSANIKKTAFSNVKLDGADLTTSQYSSVAFYGSNWCDAKRIDEGLLDFLVQHQNPFTNSYYRQGLSVSEATREHFISGIKKLCQPPREACEQPLSGSPSVAN